MQFLYHYFVDDQQLCPSRRESPSQHSLVTASVSSDITSASSISNIPRAPPTSIPVDKVRMVEPQSGTNEQLAPPRKRSSVKDLISLYQVRRITYQDRLLMTCSWTYVMFTYLLNMNYECLFITKLSLVNRRKFGKRKSISFLRRISQDR